VEFLKRMCVLACVFAMGVVFLPAETLLFPPFPQTMTVDGRIPSEKAKASFEWRVFDSLYKTQSKKHKKRHGKGFGILIPKKIHMIWLGCEPPTFCLKMFESWKKFHPDWEVKLWRESDIDAFQLKNRKAYDAAKNLAEKSDIARYEILYRIGGLYVDADFECLHSFDYLHKMCKFYAGLGLDYDDSFLYNGLIGAAPKHPILRKCIALIHPGPGDNNPDRIQYDTGPGLITRGFFAAAAKRNGSGRHVTTCVKKLQKMGVFPLPMTVVYPLPHWARKDNTDIDLVKKEWVKKESIAIHYWSVSWMKNLIPG
jgi:inositol phosphorylceramide mannosyltransferase catalytic subunit